jgi:hypothetical protein
MAGVKVYVAAPWVHKEDAKVVARQFEAAGFEISSRWHDKHHEGPDQDKDHTILAQEATDDIHDIINSNGMVVLQLEKSEGKAFEQGFILAASQFTGMNNKIIVVTPDGTRGNVFQYLNEIYTVVPDVDSALQEMKTWPGYVPLAEVVTEEAVNGE